ncbi:MAG: NAD-binding protein [Bacteroidetes bacterium]|nr:NAD-binding protein [Bacteroidota bacterium]MDA0902892.1 NAD-binding protein [Bacteroidota bacterium]MDA1241955.1 NAD-binding protein [Bacteroidota bacterium]
MLTFRLYPRIYVALGFVLGVMTLGSVGFVWIEGYNWVEALYMTVITVSTVGFGEVRELSEQGMLFTTFLIMGSIGTFAYSISALTTYFVDGEYRDIFNTARLKKEVDKLSEHVIVCGMGRVGEMAVQELIDHNTSVVVVESEPKRVERLRERNVAVIEGDATRDENLVMAGIARAKSVITTLPDDAQNLYVVLAARELAPTIHIISRASKSNSVSKLRVAGANNVIMPDKVGGSHMASLVVMPDVLEFLDHVRIQGADAINLEEISVRDLPAALNASTLGELDARNRVGVNVVGIKKSDGHFIINPGAGTPLDDACKLFVLGTAEQIKTLNRLLGIQRPMT